MVAIFLQTAGAGDVQGIRHYLERPVEEFDRDPWLLNLQNGTLDLTTGVLHDHDPDDLITKLASVVFEPDTKSESLITFLERVAPDHSTRNYLQRFAGYDPEKDRDVLIIQTNVPRRLFDRS